MADDDISGDDGEYDAVATERAEQAERADRAEERLARQRLEGIEAGRRKGGLLGAAMAGAMLSLREIYEGPATDAEIEEVVDNPDEPTDIDTDGITVHVGGTDVWAPPPERR